MCGKGDEPRGGTPMIRSKLGQRIWGVVMMILGGAATAWTGYEAIHSGYYYRIAVVLFPVLAVCGLGALLFPLDMDEFEAEHGTGRPVRLSRLRSPRGPRPLRSGPGNGRPRTAARSPKHPMKTGTTSTPEFSGSAPGPPSRD
jgi:hypothetical protein